MEKISTMCVTLLLLSLADAKDRAVEVNFPLKQEGGEAYQAQGECSGKCLVTDATGLLLWL